MRLPKSMTTVTPFSKFLALSLFIILPFAAFFLGRNSLPRTQTIPDVVKNAYPTPTIENSDLIENNSLPSTSTNLYVTPFEDFDFLGGLSFYYPSHWHVDYSKDVTNTMIKIYDPEQLSLLQNASDEAKKEFMLTIKQWDNAEPDIFVFFNDILQKNANVGVQPLNLLHYSNFGDTYYSGYPNLKAYVLTQSGKVAEISAGKYLPLAESTFHHFLSQFSVLGKTKDTAALNTYRNTKYGFQLQYPAIKEKYDTKGKLTSITCGKHITEDKTDPKFIRITIDNLAEIIISPLQGTLKDDANTGGFSKNDFEPITKSNADEAYFYLPTGSSFESTPLGKGSAIFKKNQIAFKVSFATPPQIDNGACTANFGRDGWIPGEYFKFTH